MWEESDAAFERLAITATGTDIVSVAQGSREVWDALRKVADELKDDADWQAWGGGRPDDPARPVRAERSAVGGVRTVWTEVLREPAGSETAGPPPLPPALGSGARAGANDYPPATREMRWGAVG